MHAKAARACMLRTMVRISPAFLLWPFVPAGLFEFHAWAFPLHVVLHVGDPLKNALRPIRFGEIEIGVTTTEKPGST
jgi:hypothetical protein